MGGVIGRCSPRCFYSEVFNSGGLGAGGRVPECWCSGAGLCFSGSYIQPGFRVGCRGFCSGLEVIKKSRYRRDKKHRVIFLAYFFVPLLYLCVKITI